MSPEKDNLLGVIQTLFRWKKQIITVCAIALIGSIVISLMLPNYYEAITTFYATSSDQAKPAPVGPPLKEREYYGKDEDIDRIMAIAESGELVDFLINKFHLFSHYDMDSTSTKARYKLRQRFLKLYNVQKTKYESIELSVEDKERQMAADIANVARVKINEVAQRLIRDNQWQQMENYKSNISQKEEDIRFLGDSLSKLMETFGVYDSKAQGESLSQLRSSAIARKNRNEARLNILKNTRGVRRDTILYLSSLIDGTRAEIEGLEEQINKFRKGLAPVRAIEEMLNEAGEQISLDRETLKQIQGAHKKGFPAIITLEAADLPPVKSRPKRSIIVIASVFIAFVMSAIAVLLFDTYKDVDWKAIVNG